LIYFTTIKKQVIQLILIMLVDTMFTFGWSSCGRKPGCGSKRWEASALTLRQPASQPILVEL